MVETGCARGSPLVPDRGGEGASGARYQASSLCSRRWQAPGQIQQRWISPVDAHLDPDGATCPTPHENRAAHVDVAEAQPCEPPEFHAIRNDRDDVRVVAELV